MYDINSSKAEEFISDEEIAESLAFAEANKSNGALIDEILEKAAHMKGISHREALVLLDCDIPEKNEEIFALAKRIKNFEINLLKPVEIKEFLDEYKVSGLLRKYCHFLPIEIVFGKKKEWKDGKEVDTDEDNIINNTAPIWTKKPTDLKDEDYKQFYRDLYS